MVQRISFAAVLAIIAMAFWTSPYFQGTDPATGDENGWAAVTCLTSHVAMNDVPALLRTLRSADLGYVREHWVSRFGNSSRPLGTGFSVIEKIRKSGYRVLGWADGGIGPRNSVRTSLVEDLAEAYWMGRKRAAMFGELVNVWEMSNEADLYILDPPDRVVSYNKAVYLGLKDGLRDAGIVLDGKTGILMGALGYYPGPWLERAAKNGVFDYTDGLNMHFYGHASDFGSVIKALRALANRYTDRELPVWVTECGVNAVPKDNFEEARGRRLQSEFFASTARTAVEEKVSAFFPFIFVWPPDGHAMVRRDGNPYPAWSTYARFTKEHPGALKARLQPPRCVSRTVLQWSPDFATCVPNKISGSYWFRLSAGDWAPMEGRISIYNFSDVAVRGTLSVDVARPFLCEGGEALRGLVVEIPPMGVRHVPLAFRVKEKGYRRGDVFVKFEQDFSDIPVSPLSFGLETRPRPADLRIRFGVDAQLLEKVEVQWIWAPESYEVTSRLGPWLGLNGVQVNRADETGQGWRFSVPKDRSDPRLPPMAVTKVNGLPAIPGGFLILRQNMESISDIDVRVDLVDKDGQRFCISENFGRNPFVSYSENVFLNYEDFQPYFFARCLLRPRFRPENIRQIQMRFFARRKGFVDVKLGFATPMDGRGR